MMGRTRSTYRLAALVGCLALLVGELAACSGDGDELPPPAAPPPESSPASPTPTLDERTAEAWEEIQAKFDGFMETWIKWAAEGRPGGFVDPATAELNEYADLYLWDEAVAQLTEEAENGHVRAGRPTWSYIRLVEIDWEFRIQDNTVPNSQFEVCVDESSWTLVDAETGRPVQGEPGGPHVWTVTARYVEDQDFGPDGWAPIQREVDRSRPC